jgi:hydrogenase expression/formation protein HypC
MMQDDNLELDDFIVVHVGYAIQKISPQEAQTAWQIYDEMLAAEQL